MSLSKVWNEEEHFRLVFTKMLVFVPKTGSLHTGTEVVLIGRVNRENRDFDV
jgi:hypothetical protein